jgi:hypothetical protein
LEQLDQPNNVTGGKVNPTRKNVVYPTGRTDYKPVMDKAFVKLAI